MVMVMQRVSVAHGREIVKEREEEEVVVKEDMVGGSGMW